MEETRKKDLAFVENAFYTSNEEGMGVSPNSYEQQNKMPRPGNRPRSPPKDIPFGDPLDSLEKSLERIMPEKRVVKKQTNKKASEKSQSPARFGGNNAPSETARSFEGVQSNKMGTGLKANAKMNGAKKGKLNHQSLLKNQEKYEYYTSEDE